MNKNDHVTTEEIQALPAYPGRPGVTKRKEGYQFTLCLEKEEEAALILYRCKEPEALLELPFSMENRVGNLVSIYVKGITPDTYEYNYRIGERIIQDPYAWYLTGARVFGDAEASRSPGKIRCGFKTESYHWKDSGFTPLTLSDSIIYKLQVRGFTMQKNSGVRKKGTFRGIEQKIEYLQNLGVTAVLLMPAYDYREIERETKGRHHYSFREDVPVRVNCWGYTGDACYFAPKAAFANSEHAVRDFRQMVDSLHAAGIECLMEFYFDGSVNPSMMLDILHHWKKEYHVDGFHLMGEGICQELLVKDSLLARTKLFFHDINGEYLYGEKLPLYKNAAEYNEGFLYCMRHLLKSDENMMEEFIYRNRRNPKQNGIINYLADQDGFTMMDMVSYDEKHNEANGEENQDGMEYNCSWNCGIEGASRKRSITELRFRQLRNAFLLLLLSQGTPLIFQGDEFGNSQSGNNNSWCQDNEIGWVDWNAYRKNQELFRFVRSVIALRKSFSILHMPEELKGVDYRALGYPDLSYHGAQAWFAPCERNLRHMGMMYCGDYGTHKKEFLFVAYNLHWMPHDFALPNLPEGAEWKYLFSTGNQEIIEISPERKKEHKKKKTVDIPPRTIAILIGKQEVE